MPWSINEAVDVIKWIIEEHGGNDDVQAYRQICSYIKESEKPTHNTLRDATVLQKRWEGIVANSSTTGENVLSSLINDTKQYFDTIAQQHP